MKKNYIGYKVPRNLRYRNTEISYFNSVPKLEDTKNYFYFFLNTVNHNWLIPQLCNNSDIEDCKQIKRVFENKRFLKHQPISREELSQELKEMTSMVIQAFRLDTKLLNQRKIIKENELNKLSKFTRK